MLSCYRDCNEDEERALMSKEKDNASRCANSLPSSSSSMLQSSSKSFPFSLNAHPFRNAVDFKASSSNPEFNQIPENFSERLSSYDEKSEDEEDCPTPPPMMFEDKEDSRPVTFEEKVRIRADCHRLAPDQLGNVIRIIIGREPHQQDDKSENELDINYDTLKPSTLREIEKYLNSVYETRRPF